MIVYNSRKAAELIGVNVNTLFRWINSGKITARKTILGSGWRFTGADIEAIRKWREAPLAVLDLTKTPVDRLSDEEKAARELEERKATAAHWASLPPWDDNERARRQRLSLPMNDIGDKERRLADLEAKMPGIFGENNFPDPID